MADTGQSKTSVRAEERFIGDVPGCFVLLDAASYQPVTQVLPFTARVVSTSRAVIQAEALAQKGQPIALRFDTLGVRHGTVDRVLPEGFIVSFAEQAAGADLNARIDWLKRRSHGQTAEHRVAKRVLPRNAAVVVLLGADKFLNARIKDMSETGVALVSTVQPELGHLLAVGAVAGHVARHFRGGFAVHFLERQSLAEVEGLMTLPGPSDKLLAAERIGSAA
jgi:hypothetical protein